MSGVKDMRIRVQNARWWDPPVEDRSERLPLLPRALTATNQYVVPQSLYAFLEEAQLIEVAGHSMVLVVAGDHTPKPYAYLTGAIMLTASKLRFDGLELRNHSLFRAVIRQTVKVSVLWRCPQKWVKPKTEGSPVSLPRAASDFGPASRELDQPCLVRM